MLLSCNLVTSPTVEPVTIAQVKQHLRIDADFTDDDALLQIYVTAARQHCEQYTRRAFFQQQWQLTLDHFPTYLYGNTINPSVRRDFYYYAGVWNGMVIALPKPPCVSVESIKYIDINGTPQTLDPSAYRADLTSTPARIVPVAGMTWPLATLYIPGSVQVNFTAGSYTEASDCPQTIVMAILLLVGHWYEHREAISETSMKEIPFSVSALLDMHTYTMLDYESVL